MAYEKKPKADEKKKTVSARERYEAYLEKERNLEEKLESMSDEELKNIDMSKMSAKERYAVYRARDARREAEPSDVQDIEEEILAMPEEEEAFPEQEEFSDGKETSDAENAAENHTHGKKSKSTEELRKSRASGGAAAATDVELAKRAFVRRIIATIAFVIAALALQLIMFHVPFTPNAFKIDFSALPELFATITYGPLTGIIVVVIKNILYVLIRHNAVATAVSNVIVDSVFVVIAGTLYTKGIFMKAKGSKRLSRDQARRRRMISRSVNAFGSGVVGGIVAAIVSFFTINFIAFPIIFRKYPPDEYKAMLLQQYNNGLDGIRNYIPSALGNILPEITSVMVGTLVFNVEITFIKYFLVAVLTAIIYPMMSDFLHYRK